MSCFPPPNIFCLGVVFTKASLRPGLFGLQVRHDSWDPLEKISPTIGWQSYNLLRRWDHVQTCSNIWKSLVEQQSLPRFSVATSHFSLFPFPPFISLLTRPYASEGFADAKHVMTRRVYWKCPKGSKGMFFFLSSAFFRITWQLQESTPELTDCGKAIKKATHKKKGLLNSVSFRMAIIHLPLM